LDHPRQPSLPPSRGLDFFQPTWGRGLLAVAVAGIAFLLPQEAPLAYYPLNNPSDGLLLLEITCSASATGETQIFYDTGRHFNQLDSIRIPISPSSQPFTYTFPLPDAPIVAMRLNPLNCPGEFTITNFRIINRRGETIRRISQDDFQPTNEIAAIVPITGGWKLITTPAAKKPFSRIELHEPIIAKGMNVRNFQRCLLSWGYLALMLWILLLAVYFALQLGREGGGRKEKGDRIQEPGDRKPETGERRQETGDRSQEPGDAMAESGERKKETEDRSQETGVRRAESGDQSQESEAQSQELGVRRQNPGGRIAENEFHPQRVTSSLRRGESGWRRLVRSALFLAGIALLFSAVGNRRLIKDAVSYANFELVPRVPTLRLEIDLAVSRPIAAQLFWDTGHGFNEDESLRRTYEPNSNVQTLLFDLPLGRPIRALRFDPFDAAGEIRLVEIRVMDSAWHTRLRLPVSVLRATNEIASIEAQGDQVVIRTTPGATDPILEFTPEAAAAISKLMVQEKNEGAGRKGR
jgi:hypothetical protein